MSNLIRQKLDILSRTLPVSDYKGITMKKNLFALGLVSTLFTQSALAVDLIGYTKSKSPLDVVADISGIVETVNIETGEQVKSGDTLGTVKTEDFELEVSKEQANLRLAEADLKLKRSLYERYLKLIQKNSLSQNELDIALADFESAKAKVALAKIALEKSQRNLQKTQFNSDINGYVVSRLVEDGSWVTQGDLLYQIVNIDVLTVRLFASEFDIGELKVGLAIEVWAEVNPQLKVQSVIKRIGVEVDPTNFSYPVEVEIENPQHIFKPGMSMHATTAFSSLTETEL